MTSATSHTKDTNHKFRLNNVFVKDVLYEFVSCPLNSESTIVWADFCQRFIDNVVRPLIQKYRQPDTSSGYYQCLLNEFSQHIRLKCDVDKEFNPLLLDLPYLNLESRNTLTLNVRKEIDNSFCEFLVNENTIVNVANLRNQFKEALLSEWECSESKHSKSHQLLSVDLLSKLIICSTAASPRVVEAMVSHSNSNRSVLESFSAIADSSASFHDKYLASDVGETEISGMYEHYDANAFQRVCHSLKSQYINSHARQEIWMYILLNTERSSLIREYARLSIEKGQLSSSTPEVSNLIQRSVMNCFKSAFHTSFDTLKVPISSFSNNILVKRACLLVHALYVLTDQISPRTCYIALILLHIYPKISPISEITLRMYDAMLNDVLPSILVYKEFSTSSVVSHALSILRNEDEELWHHLHLNNPYEDAAGIGPNCVLMLREWLECAFLGWFREHTSIYLMDQIIIQYSFERNKHSLVECQARLCVSLLVVMRERLLKSGLTTLDLKSVCQSHSTKEIVLSLQGLEAKRQQFQRESYK